MLTQVIIYATLASVAISDVALMWRGIPTYSRTLKELGARVSFFPYAWGVLGGHIWSPAPVLDIPWWAILFILVSIGLALTAIHLIMRGWHLWWVRWLPLAVYLPIGIPIGAVIWSMG